MCRGHSNALEDKYSQRPENNINSLGLEWQVVVSLPTSVLGTNLPSPERVVGSFNPHDTSPVLLESIRNLKTYCSQWLQTEKSTSWSETHRSEAFVSSFECKSWNFIFFCKKARFGSAHCYSFPSKLLPRWKTPTSQNVLQYSLSQHDLHLEHLESYRWRGICLFHNIGHLLSTQFTVEIMHLFTILWEKWN